MRTAAILGLGCLALWLPAALQRGDHRISGVVLDAEDGTPVESAQASSWLLPDGAPGPGASSDPQGRFVLRGVPRRSVRLRIRAEGYQESEWRLEAAGGRSLTFRLWRLGVVAGRVRAADGSPVPGAAVALMAADAEGRARLLPPGRIPGGVALTAPDGSYRLFGIPPGRYAAGVNRPLAGRAAPEVSRVLACWAGPEWIDIPPGGGQANADFVLAEGESADVRGIVDWPPERGPAVVALTPAEFPFMTVARALPGRDGSFAFQGVPAGRYVLSAVGPSLGNSGLGGLPGEQPLIGELEIEARRGEDARRRLHLSPLRLVKIRISEPENSGRARCEPQATVRLYPARGIAPALYLRLEIPTGGAAAALPDVRLSAWVEAHATECYGSPSPVPVAAGGEDQEVALPLVPAASMEGKVLAGKQTPGSPFLVLLVPEQLRANAPGWIGLFTEPDGSFAAHGLPPGVFRILATDLRDWDDPSWRPRLADAMPVELLPGGSARVELVDPAQAGRIP